MVKFGRFALSIPMVVAWLPAMASAQTAPTEPNATPVPSAVGENLSSGGEITVTARRRNESIQKVPIAVTALSGNFIAERRITNVENLTQNVPGLTVTQGPGGKSAPILAIRGQRVQEQTGLVDPSVGLYFGDILYSRVDGAGGAFYDLSSVEVLKGPQGTLFGRNTTGGAILVKPNRPTHEFEGVVKAGIGNYRANTQEFALNLPASDTLAFRFAGQRENRRGYIKDDLSPSTRLGKIDTLGLRGSTLFNPTESVENLTVATFFRDKGKPLGWRDSRLSVPDEQYNDIYHIRSGKPQNNDLKTWDIANTTTVKLNDDISAKLILGYRNVDRNDKIDLCGYNCVLYINYVTLDKQFTGEFQLLGKAFDQKLDWIVGLYYFDERARNKNFFSIITPFDAVGDAKSKNLSKSVFAQGTYRLTESLSLTAGARLTSDRREALIRNRFLAPTSLVLAGGNTALLTSDGDLCNLTDSTTGLPLKDCRLLSKKSWTEPTWTVSLDNKFSDTVMGYIAHRHGYRSGALQPRAGRTSAISNIADPEFVDDIEAGLKTKWGSGDVRGYLNVAAFYSFYKDAQRLQNDFVDGIATSLLLNAGSARIKGIEADFSARFGKNFELTGFLELNDGKYKKFELFNANTGLTDDISNWKLGALPKLKFNIGANYTIPLAADQGKIIFGANYFHTSSFINDDVNIAVGGNAALDYSVIDEPAMDRFTIKSYGLVDLRLDWKSVLGSRVDAGLWMKNALDKKYDVAKAQVPGLLQVSAAGAPRTFGFDLGYRF